MPFDVIWHKIIYPNYSSFFRYSSAMKKILIDNLNCQLIFCFHLSKLYKLRPTMNNTIQLINENSIPPHNELTLFQSASDDLSIDWCSNNSNMVTDLIICQHTITRKRENAMRILSCFRIFMFSRVCVFYDIFPQYNGRIIILKQKWVQIRINCSRN